MDLGILYTFMLKMNVTVLRLIPGAEGFRNIERKPKSDFIGQQDALLLRHSERDRLDALSAIAINLRYVG